MRKLSFFITSVLAVFFLTGCNDNEKISRYTVEYEVNEPVFMPVAEFRANSIGEMEGPQPIEQRGKICFYKDYLYISEAEKGIHIIDNRNPSNPVNKGFIEVMGIHDVAIRENKLYVDSFIDLVWFDLSNPESLIFEGRLENAFPYALPVVDNEYWCDTYFWNDPAKKDQVAVAWNVTIRQVEYQYDRGTDALYMDAASETSSGSGNSAGVNGSYSLFNVYDQYLYTIVRNDMVIFDLLSSTPVEVGRQDQIGQGMDVETIFRYGENLFLGTPSGMLIYSATDPVKPEYQSCFFHIYGCDPVVVEDNLAYVTVRSGNNCGQNVDMLYIIDISNLKQPKEIASYSMTKPKGLGIDNKLLFVCDDGLKIYRVDDLQTIMSTRLAHIKGMDGHDVIPFNNVLMMIADNAIYQYDYSAPEDIKLLSKLEFK